MTEKKCVEITAEDVKIEDKQGNKLILNVDTVVVAAGMNPDVDTIEQLREGALNFYPVGDCIKPERIMEAVHSGFYAALDIL